MADQERLNNLASIAAGITGEPLDEQFRILGEAGLRLDDINWRNQVTPHPETPDVKDTRIPTVLDGTANG